jgi:hypothetical protein
MDKATAYLDFALDKSHTYISYIIINASWKWVKQDLIIFAALTAFNMVASAVDLHTCTRSFVVL